MKKIIVSVMLVLFSSPMIAQADITFEKYEIDFGTYEEKDDTLWYAFKYKNTGSDPLIISDIKTACECTLADWVKKPIMPGQTGIVKAGYKYKGKVGTFNKALTITSNTTPAISHLTIKGVILDKKPK